MCCKGDSSAACFLRKRSPPLKISGTGGQRVAVIQTAADAEGGSDTDVYASHDRLTGCFHANRVPGAKTRQRDHLHMHAE